MEISTTPSKSTSSLSFLFVVLALLGASSLNRFLNSGAILWINELIIFTAPIFWFTKKQNVSWKKLCKLNPISKKVYQLTIIIGFSIYPIFLVLSSLVEIILNSTIGHYYELNYFMETTRETSLYFFLFITGIMILAPIFEELFFRGFLQNGLGGYQQKSGWILAGFLFGAVHFANHISNAIGAIFLGLVLSYIAFRTNSIWPTIIIHAIVNILSATLIHIPQYFGFTLSLNLLFSPIIVGLAITILIISLRQLPQGPKEDFTPNSFGIKPMIPIIIALLILGSIAVVEINSRIAAPNTESSSITAGEIDQALLIANIEIEAAGANLHLEYYIKADNFNGNLLLQTENGNEIWTSPTQIGQDLTIQSFQSFENLQVGSYSLIFIGTATGLEIETSWMIR